MTMKKAAGQWMAAEMWKEPVMLHLNLCEEDYLTINGNIVIEVSAVSGKYANLSIDAPKDIPILRGKVLERSGGKRPACLDEKPRKKPTFSNG